MWLLFVLLYDMALLGWLVVDQGRTVTPYVLNALLLLNPADIYRLLNLTATPDVSGFAGVAGLGAHRPWPGDPDRGRWLAWMVAPLVAAVALFGRRQV